MKPEFYSLALSVPEDLDARLIESTGCSTAEHLAALGLATTGASLARLIAPLIAENGPAQPELGEICGAALAENRFAALDAVRKIFAASPELTTNGSQGGRK